MLSFPLTIVEAPVGYGKTTAVREFLLARGGPVLWFSFFPSENTSASFWDGFVKEIEKIDQCVGMKLGKLGFPSDAPETANVLSLLDELNRDKDTILVIDDYHLARDPRIGEFLCLIALDEPDNFHVVVITRDTTNLRFGELIAKGLCNVISQQLLAFTGEEIREYCAATGIVPEEEDLAKLIEYTGGWISLVYLILLGLERGIPVGMSKAIDQLVEDVLYNAYDDRIRQFLLELAVMDRFSAAQAEFVTRESRTVEYLAKLLRENAFIAYDEQEDVYKIHNVLLDFLRRKQAGRTALKELFCRVGEWFLNQKAFTSAYGYLFRAGETERILSLLSSENNITNAWADFEGWQGMFEDAPREMLQRYPIAYLQYISLMILGGDPGARESATGRLDELQQICERAEDLSADLRSRILAEISVVRIFAAFNLADEMLTHTEEAFRLLKGRRSWLIQRKGEFTFGCPHFLYSYYREPGSLKATADIIASRFPLLPRIADGCGTGCEYVGPAEYALETGDWQAAERGAFMAIYRAREREQTGIVICATFALTRLYILQGRVAEAVELLRQLRADVSKERSSIYNTTVDLCEGYIYGCLGRLDKVPFWLISGDLSPARFLFQGLAFNCIVYGKALLLLKDYFKFEALTEGFKQQFSILSNQLGHIHNRIHEAVAKYRLYGMEEGISCLRTALDMGRHDHIVLPFAENVSGIAEMMRSVVCADGRDEYAKTVLRCCEQYAGSLKHVSHRPVSLSPREVQVLALAAEGLKREEIAVRLSVSAGTVKTHLENTYRKLDVGGKTAAIRKAQTLKIL